MSPFDIVLVVYGVILALTAILVVYRMIVGPTILDRAVSTDSLVVLVVLGMALYTASARASWAGPAMLGLTGLAFIATVTFARFVAREEPLQGRRRRRDAEEAGTHTGPLDAIHIDHDSADAEPDPINSVDDQLTDHDVLAAGSGASSRGFGAEEGSRGFEDDDEAHGFGAEDGTEGWR